jgi:hypothetical protein
MPLTNGLAYFAGNEEKSFKILTRGMNPAKLFFFVNDVTAK